jgi:hypothetical protein
VASTVVGNHAVFAGGYFQEDPSNAVDLYDAATDTWTSSHLSQTRALLGAASTDGRAFFAGGDIMDIFDVATSAWSSFPLKQDRDFPAVAGFGDEIVITGGKDTNGSSDSLDTAEIYNISTGQSRLVSVPLSLDIAAATTLGSTFVFPVTPDVGDDGGFSTTDVYDALTDKWSTLTVPNGIGAVPGGPSIGTNAFFITSDYNHLAIYNEVTSRWKVVALPTALAHVSIDAVTSIGQRVILAGGNDSEGNSSNLVESYDNVSGTWTAQPPLSVARTEFASATVGGQLLIAGGATTTDSADTLNTVDVYQDNAPVPLFDGGVAGRANGKATAVITNSGDADFAAPYTVQVYAIPPRQYHGAVLVGSQAISSSLVAGASLRLSVPISIPPNAPAGTYHLVAMVRAADGTLTPFAGATEDFTVKSSAKGHRAAAKPAALARPIFSTNAITTLSPNNAWLVDAAGLLE